MADSTQTADAEYKMIRSEIDQKITLHNTLLTFTITTTGDRRKFCVNDGI